MQPIKPPRLKPGDRVGVVAPSQSVYDRLDRFNHAGPKLEKLLNIKLEYAPHCLGKYHYSSGTVEERLADFHQMIKDPTIKAIFFAVGGHTANELIPRLDYQLIKDNPKIITGLSDCTTLLNPIYAKTGLITFHGFEFSGYGYPEPRDYELASLKTTFFAGNVGQIRPNPAWRDWRDTPTTYSGWSSFRDGSATGHLVGGNISSIKHFIDTPYSPDWQGAILFLEAYKLAKRTLHNALSELALRQVFRQISGLILGYCVGSDDPSIDGNDRPLRDVVLEATEGYTFPIIQVGEIGHYVENAIIPIGARAALDTRQLSFTIEESVVS